MKANKIKVIFIKWLLAKWPESIIGNEVLFSLNRCRTDILQILNNKTHAYEIKSDSDNFESIDEQLNNYLESFDYTYLVVTEKHLHEKLNRVDNNIEIYLIKNDSTIVKIRNAKISKNIKKKNLLCFLNKKYLLKILNKKGQTSKSVFELRWLCEKMSIKRLKQECISALIERYSKLMSLFLHDTNGKNITVDDLVSLTGNLYTDELR